MAVSEKSREMRLRNAAKRRGLRLIKRRRFDPNAFDYGLYVLVPDQPDAQQTAAHLFANRQGVTLDQVEQQLTG